MKTIVTSSLPILKLVLVVLLFIGFVLNVEAQEEEYDIPILKIKGDITYSEPLKASLRLVIYKENKVYVEETLLKDKFKYELDANYIYTLEIKSKGFYTKRISIDTHMSEEALDRGYSYDFDIALKPRGGETVPDDLLDFPSALISFDEDEEEFVYAKEYDKQLRLEILEASKFTQHFME